MKTFWLSKYGVRAKVILMTTSGKDIPNYKMISHLGSVQLLNMDATSKTMSHTLSYNIVLQPCSEITLLFHNFL